MFVRFSHLSFAAGLVALGALFSNACSSSSSGPSGPSGPAGGPASGPADAHCGATKQKTSLWACDGSADAGVDASDVGPASSDASSADGNVADSNVEDVGGSAYGPTSYGAAANDDACKYKVTWTSDPIYRNTDVTFHLAVMRTFDGVWACNANPYIEAYLNDTHPAPNSNAQSREVSDGNYDIGPIRFDAAGRWTVRFHLYGDCSDLTPESPHGHAAFYVDVP